MNHDDPRARIGYEISAVSRAKSLALKALLVVGGVVTLASAFAISLVVLAIALVVVLISGGYLWWKTRDLRKQFRERMQAQSAPAGRIIEGEVISPEDARRWAKHR
jgi:O-antigen/teichoic acid export membrane protein